MFITKQLLSVARTLCMCISGGFKGITFAGLNVVCIKFQFRQYWFWEGKLQDILVSIISLISGTSFGFAGTMLCSTFWI